MIEQRFVVVGLARPRAPWFRDVTAWANASVIPVEFQKCIGIAELRARLERAGRLSALLVDAAAPGFDRSVIAAASARGVAVLVVDDLERAVDWSALGADEMLPVPLTPDALVDALVRHARTEPDRPTASALLDIVPLSPPSPRFQGSLTAVVGGAGAGTSVVSMALAQGVARLCAQPGDVLLADMALRAHLAMYHDTGDVIPGLQELVEAVRRADLGPTAMRALTYDVAVRRYALLLGLRRPRDWTVLRAEAVAAAVDVMRATFRHVVADIDADLDGEDETGSADADDRTSAARVVIDCADRVLVVVDPSLKGLHEGAALVREVLQRRPDAMVVVNRAPRLRRARAEITETLATLIAPDPPRASPVFLPVCRQLEAVHRHALPLPDSLVTPLLGLHVRASATAAVSAVSATAIDARRSAEATP